MPIRSEQRRNAERGARSGDWSAGEHLPRRSVFGNYREEPLPDPPSGGSANAAGSGISDRQSGIDSALARSFLYRATARAFEDPSPEGWASMADPSFQQAFGSAVAALAEGKPALAAAARAFTAHLTAEAFDSFRNACSTCFGHAARGSCPLNEIEYGDLKADGLFQPHRLADLAAFYRAFGLEVAEDAMERHDHLCIELEFMSVLAAKEAYALEHQLTADELALCLEAQRKFLREHLGRWTLAFARRLANQAADTPLAALADWLRAFVETECVGHGVAPGSEDLLLRPVEEADESLCDSCGQAKSPPGAGPAIAPG
jgi:DMSO reductase family type II enzyme chaperone